jgi:hypothetical protein
MSSTTNTFKHKVFQRTAIRTNDEEGKNFKKMLFPDDNFAKDNIPHLDV